MRAVTMAVVVLFSVGIGAEEGPSASSGGRSISVLSGKTLGSGMVVQAEFGWPSVSATLLGAVSDKVDLGGRLSLMYGYEGITAFAGVPGVKAQGIFRLELLERGKLNLGLRFEPGPFFYGFPGGSEFGLALPLELAMGIALTPKVMLNAGIDVPMFVVFGPYGGLAVPLLIGGGVEYQLDRNLALTLNTRLGPSVPLTGRYYDVAYWDYGWCQSGGNVYRCGPYYRTTVPAMEMLLGVSYRL